MITPELTKKTDETKNIISSSKLPPEEKKHWLELMDFALENCNGLTQEQKIQGIAELLLEHTRILAQRRITDHENIAHQRAIDDMLTKVSEINNVQQNQQTMIRSLHDNMEKLFQLSDLLRQTNDRIGHLEVREEDESKKVDDRINTVFAKTADDLVQIRQEILDIRNDSQKNHDTFLQKLDEYTTRLSDYDREQDKKMHENFKELREQGEIDKQQINDKFSKIDGRFDDIGKKFDDIGSKLDTITENTQKDPESWKGVLTRLFTPRTTIILVLTVIILFILRPDTLAAILSHLPH